VNGISEQLAIVNKKYSAPEKREEALAMIRQIDDTLVTARHEVKQVEIRVNSDLYQITELIQSGEAVKASIGRTEQSFDKRNAVEKESRVLDGLKTKKVASERTLKA
jgi:hypothetical protein